MVSAVCFFCSTETEIADEEEEAAEEAAEFETEEEIQDEPTET